MGAVKSKALCSDCWGASACSGESRQCLKQRGGRSGTQLGVGVVRGCGGGSVACRVSSMASDEEEDEEDVWAAGQAVDSGTLLGGR